MAKDFGDYWDDLADVQAARGRAKKVLKYIQKYHPKAKSVLELGVGSGNVLKCFPKRFALYGLDIYPNYLKLAKRKIPHAKLILSSMDNIKIKKKFDVIFSIYDSINFLESLSQWKKTFESVSRHMNKDAIFIFDAYNPKMLEKAKTWSIFSKEPFGFMWDKGIVKGNRLTWHFSIFEKKGRNYELNEFDFHEWIFPVKKVETELKKRFRIIEKLDGETLKKPNNKTYRLLYVVRLKVR